MSNEQLNIADLRRLHEAATKENPGCNLVYCREHSAYHTNKPCPEVLLAAFPALLDALEEARAERSKLRDAIGVDVSLEGGMAWVVEGIKKFKAERDALKATLAKHAESERAWCELATARGAKLAALVEAMEHIRDIMGGHDGCQGFSSPEDVWGIADKALAAAKVQP